MREIKFRAWHPKTKEIIPVETIDWDETQYLTEVTAGYTWGEKFDPITFQQLVLMQYTGLKDKNGKEIYEGDIVAEHGHYVNSDKVLHQAINWLPNHSAWMRGEYDRLTPKNVEYWKIEIIGNIYESPELLATNR